MKRFRILKPDDTSSTTVAGLVRGIEYFDAQFDDARLAIALACTAIRNGGGVVDYCRVTGLIIGDGHIAGVEVAPTGSADGVGTFSLQQDLPPRPF